MTWTGGRRSAVYLDGRLRETYAATAMRGDDARALVLRGMRRTSQVDEVRTYSTDLSARAVARHYAAGVHLFGRTPQASRATTHARAADTITPDEPPVLSGDALDGGYLEASTGTWTASDPIDFTWQWLRCDVTGDDCAEIPDAIDQVYYPTSDDIGGTLRARVSATSPDGDGVATTDASDVVAPAPPFAVAQPEVTGDAVATTTLTASAGAWAGTEPLTFAYAWQRCDTNGENCTSIVGATDDTYTVDHENIGSTLRVDVAATNAAGIEHAVSAATAVVTPPEAPSNAQAPEVTGTTEVGHELSASDGEWVGTAPLTYTYQWQRCEPTGLDCVDIDDAADSTYTLTADDDGSALRVTVHATNVAGADESSSWITSQVTMAPEGTNDPEIDGDAVDGSRLVASRGGWTGSRPLATTYQWQRCDPAGEDCTDIADATGAAYDVVSDDVDATLRVVVGVSNGAGAGSATSAVTDVVIAAAPQSVTLPKAAGITQPGAVLTARTGQWAGTPEVTYTYAWQLCDAHGESCATIDDETEDELDVDEAMSGSTVRVIVTATNAIGTASATSAPTRVVGQFSATISGTPRVGGVLTAVPDQLLGVAPDYTYQWQRCAAAGDDCADLDGETGKQLRLGAADSGKTIRVIVVADDGTQTVTGTSHVTVAVVDRAPVNVAAPVLTGRMIVGSTAGTTDGEWNPAGALTYRWSRCDVYAVGCTPIVGATGRNYELQPDDLGMRMKVSVTATTSGGSKTVAAQVGPVVAAPAVANTDAPIVTRHAGPVGDVLSATSGTWDADGSLTYTYVWQRCDVAGGACEPIPGAGGPTYALGQHDLSQTLRVVVTAHAAAGAASTRSAATTPILAGTVSAIADGAIVGAAASGLPLSVDGMTWTGLGPLDLTYEWQRCNPAGASCVAISGATDATYLLTDDDVGSTLRRQATAVGAGRSDVELTDVTDVVASAGGAVSAPTVTAAPTITGTLAASETLTATTGTWSSVGPLTYTYQWRRCSAAGVDCADVVGATAVTYAAGLADVGHALEVQVLAQDAVGTGLAVATTRASVRAIDGPVAETAPIVSGTARGGAQLSATNGTWSTADAPLSYAVRWQTCDAAEACAGVEGATGPTYTIPDEDAGVRYRAVVTAEDASGHQTTAVSDPTDAASSSAPDNAELPVVTGVTTTGETLHASAGRWDGLTPLTMDYQWQRCDLDGADCADIDAATSADYVPTTDDAGATLRVTVFATNSAGDNAATSDATAPVAMAAGPAVSAGPTLSGGALENATLTVDPGTWTSAGTITYTYRWLRCSAEQAGACAPIDGATAATYGVSGDDVFSTLRAEVTAHDAVGTRTVLTDATDEVEAAEADAGAEIANTARPSIDGEARAGLALVAEDGGWDAGDVGLMFRYRWWACDTAAAHCERIESGDDATFTPTTSEVGKRLRLMVTAVASDASATIMSAPTDAVRPPHPTAVTAPALWGDAVDGAVLSTDAGVWVPDDVEIDEHWQRCDAAGESCADIADAAGVDYWLTPDDIGHTVRAVVTATNGDGTGTAYSPVSDVIAPQPPTSYWQPSFTGLAREDSQLTADPGGWGGSPELSYTYAWQRCDAEGEDCAPISGATAQTYNLTDDDLGLRVRVEVTADNAAGSASSTSEPSDVVDSAALPALDPEHQPTIDGDAHDGQVLTADPGGWSGSDPLAYTYVWERCDAIGDDCAAISGATDPSYVLTSADVGATVRFVVTAHNPTGTAEETTAATDVVAVGAPVSLDPPTINGEWHAGGVLAAAPGRWGGTAPATYAYQWRRCDADGLNCTDLDGETTNSYTLTMEDAHQTVAVAVTATNAHGTETATSDPTRVGGLLKPVNVTAPTLDGTAHTGQWLVADPGGWDNEPDEYRYTWDVCDAQGQNCFSLISDSSFYLDSWYAGRRIRVTVTAADAWDEDPPSASSALTDVIGSSDPVNLTPPALADETPMVGRPLAVATGDWVGDSISYLYQWRRCRNGSCSDIFGANAAAFTPRYSDVGYTLQVRVTGSTTSGTSAVTTAPSRSVGEGAPFSLEAPSVSGQTVVGAELQSDAGSWSAYWDVQASWERCDANGDDCAPIPDSDGWYYRTTHADLGNTVRSVVVATGNGGKTSARSLPTAAINPATKPVFVTEPAIQGVIAVGQIVDGGSPEVSGSDDIFFGGQWERCATTGEGCEPIDGATEWSYVIQRSDAGSVLRFDASLTNGWGSVSRLTPPTTVVGAPPPVANVLAPTIVQNWWSPRYSVGDVIESDRGTWAGQPEHIDLQWQRCDPHTVDTHTDAASCTDIEDATDGRYEAVEADGGQRLRLKVTASSSDHRPIVAYSELTQPIGVYISIYADFVGPVEEGSPITVQAQYSPYDELPTQIGYKWEISRWSPEHSRWLTNTVSTGSDPTFTPGPGTAGSSITAYAGIAKYMVGTSIRLGVAETTTSGTIQPPLRNTGLPTVTGDLTAGEELTASDGDWTGGDGDVAYDYGWQRCDASGEACSAIVGASAATYATTAADIGHTLRSVVAAHADGGTWGLPAPEGGARHAVRSAATGVITPGDAPAATEPPVIEGTTTEDQTLHATPGTWTGTGVLSYTYQWESCDAEGTDCHPLTGHGADTGNYKVQDTDLGAYLQVVVRAESGVGAATETSTPVGPVAAGGVPDPDAVPKVTLIGAPGPGSTLITDGGTWTDAQHKDLGYAWQRCDAAGAGCAEIEDATSDAYVLTAEDAGHRLRAVVTATTDGGTASAISDDTDVIGTAPSASAEGEVVSTDSDRKTLSVAQPDGSDPQALTSCDQLPDLDSSRCEIIRPRLSGNLRAVAFEATDPTRAYGAGEIYVINADGTGLRHVRSGSDPAWTPEDAQIIYTAKNASGSGTRSMAVDAGGAQADDPVQIVMASDPDDPGSSGGFGLMSLTGTQPLSIEGADMDEDGELTFVGRHGTQDVGLYVAVSALDRDPRKLPLSDDFDDVRDPRFTPDGQAIAFTADLNSEQEKGSSLWEIDRDGGNLHRLSPDDGAQYGPAAPTTEEVITTRRPWETCVHPSFTGVTTMAANCSRAKGRGYAMNHDGSNPHFLGSDDALDVEKRGRKAHAAAEGHDCTWHVYMGNMILDGGEPSEYRSASKRVLPAGGLTCVSVNETTEVDFKMCLQWRHVHHAPGEGYHAVAGQCQSVRSTVAALLVRPLAFEASCGTKISGDVELHLGLKRFNVIGSKTGAGPKFSWGNRTVQAHCLNKVERMESDANLWRILALTSPVTIGVGRTIRDGRPAAEILAGDMGGAGLLPDAHPEWGQAFNPRSAWSPHHVIPIGEHNSAIPAHPAQAFAYRCHMHPNDQRNGVWLRRLHGPLEDGTDDLQAYFDHGSSIERAWAGRAMHWNYDGRYSVKVSAAMTPVGVLPSVICRAHGSTLGWNAIHTKITNELTSGHIPGIPSGRPGR